MSVRKYFSGLYVKIYKIKSGLGQRGGDICFPLKLFLVYMTEHNYSVFCNQKQGSTKNVNANLSHYIFLSSLAPLARYLRH